MGLLFSPAEFVYLPVKKESTQLTQSVSPGEPGATTDPGHTTATCPPKGVFCQSSLIPRVCRGSGPSAWQHRCAQTPRLAAGTSFTVGFWDVGTVAGHSRCTRMSSPPRNPRCWDSSRPSGPTNLYLSLSCTAWGKVHAEQPPMAKGSEACADLSRLGWNFLLLLLFALHPFPGINPNGGGNLLLSHINPFSQYPRTGQLSKNFKEQYLILKHFNSPCHFFKYTSTQNHRSAN